jgi:DNA-binding response OmpR family regulator
VSAQAEAVVATRSVLVIDDQPKIVSFVSRALKAHGLAVVGATSGLRGLELARTGDFDLVILDLLMPDATGVSVLRATREALPDQRVLVLSALSDVAAKVNCLELGASDYLTKPFALDELVARVNAQLRISRQLDEVATYGRLRLNLRRREADVGAGPVALPAREFMLLEHLMTSPAVVCSREELLRKVWGISFDPGTNVVDVCVRRLRTKLGPHVVETLRGVGYRLGDV